MDEADAARKAAHEEWQKRVGLVMARLDAIAGAPGTSDADAQLDEAAEEWRGLAANGRRHAPRPRDALARQTTSSRRSWRARGPRSTTRRRAEAERLAELERAAERRAAFVAICERVEALRGEDAPDEIEKARAEWEGMPGASAQERDDAELRARFDESCRRAVERHQNRQAIEKMHTRLGELSLEADRLSTPDDHTPEGPEREAAWRAVADEWQSLAGQVDGLDETVAARFAEAAARVRQREDEKRAAAERTLKQQVQRVEQLDRARHGARGRRGSDAARGGPRGPRSEIGHGRAAAGERPRAARACRASQGRAGRGGAASPRPARDGRVEAVCQRRRPGRADREGRGAAREVLARRRRPKSCPTGRPSTKEAKPEDIEKAARELHEIQERWKQVAEAPRAQAQALWHRYRQAADPIQTKARVFFAQRAEERTANLRLKMVLVERAEALAESTDWIKTADELKKLQAEWQLVGPVPRQDTKITWKRFRDACDRFFTRRNADLTERKETWSANLAKKDALCVRAEELAASREWDGARARSGGCRPNGRRSARCAAPSPRRSGSASAPPATPSSNATSAGTRSSSKPNRPIAKALVVELEALAAPAQEVVPTVGLEELAGDAETPPAPPRHDVPSDLLERVRSLRTRWNQTSSLVRQGADPLSARFIDALARLMTGHPDAFKGTELDVEASRQKMEKLCARVEGFLTDAAPAPAGSQALAEMLREALASNTIGGRAGEEVEVAGDGRRSAPGPGVVEPPRPGSRRSRQPADRTVPQGVQPLLRSARGARCRRRRPAATREAGGGEIEQC